MPTTPLLRYVREVVGPARVVAWHRRAGAKRVLEVRDRAGVHWFGKRIHAEPLWQGELSGYDWWGSLDATPSLRDRSEELQAMVVSAVPGALAREDDPGVFEAAGAVLRRLHAARAPVRDDGWLVRSREMAAIDHERTVATGTEVDTQLVALCLQGLQRLADAEALASVPTHGDFLPRNWVVDDSGLRTIDFTEAALRPAVHDFVRLRFGPCWDQPHLWSALLSGYGRELTAAEEQLLGHQLLLEAVLAIGWGTEHGLEDSRQRGLEVLGSASRRTGTVDPRGPGRSRWSRLLR